MNKNTNSNQTGENKPGLSVEQKQRMKKYTVFALMGIICAGCLWFIFAPSDDEKAKQGQQSGFNANIPDPKNETMIGDKRDAYEQEQIQQKQAERMRSLEDFSALLGGETAQPAGDLVLLDDEPKPAKPSGGTKSRMPSSIESSARAYQDVNRTLGNFYESPKNDPVKEKLQADLEELRERLDEQERRKNAADEQLALMEKSFQMAAKYMPGTAGTNEASADPSSESVAVGKHNVPGKTAAVSVTQAREQTVSLLQPEMSGLEFIEAYGQPRNMGFVTDVGETTAGTRNTLSACVQENQTVTDGQSVRLRLLEPMRAGHMTVPRHTLLAGTAKIQGERLFISIHFLEYRGTIIPVELSVYDTDGQAGIFIPDLQGMNAAKEIAANMGTSAGTSFNINSDAGEQFVADMGRNLIQGVSQFTARKLREVKVHLKAGYRVYLLSEESLNRQ
jgi:conjugative transposon TraM protein